MMNLPEEGVEVAIRPNATMSEAVAVLQYLVETLEGFGPEDLVHTQLENLRVVIGSDESEDLEEEGWRYIGMGFDESGYSQSFYLDSENHFHTSDER